MTVSQFFVCVVLFAAYLLINWLILRGGTGAAVSSRGRHRDDGRPRWVLLDVDVTPVVVAAVEAADARRAIYEQWMSRRAAEAPFFARLAAEMGLGYALGGGGMSVCKWFRRMNVVVPVGEALPDPVGEARLAAQHEMAALGLRPGGPKFVQFEEHFGQRFACFTFRAYPTWRALGVAV